MDLTFYTVKIELGLLSESPESDSLKKLELRLSSKFKLS
jgi:hypothetical protein